MNTLYVFAIGGSGERVLNSFIMMLAAGMPINANAVVPVFMDNDVESKAFDDSINLIKYYRNAPTKGQDQTGAHTMIKALSDSEKFPSFFRVPIEEPVVLNRDGASIGDLNSLIGKLNDDQTEIAEERDLLFTSDDLNMPLNDGFVGNPNIGSVVLNTLSLHCNEFEELKAKIGNEDGVIVLGSLFGGTGAAGIPLIINKINELGTERPKVGAVTLLPYFTTNHKDGTTQKYDVDPVLFDTKTRAALMYYDKYLSQGVLDSLYYVGDGDFKATYTHCIGGKKQSNPAHPIEVMAGLSIFDFTKSKNNNDRIVYKIPVWEYEGADSNLMSIMNRDLRVTFVKFQMMKQIFEEDDFLKKDIAENIAYVANLGFTEYMRKSTFSNSSNDIAAYPRAWGMNMFFKAWDRWIADLSNLANVANKRKMNLFNDKNVPNVTNFTWNFFTGADYGIANTKTTGVFHKKEEVVDSKIKNHLMDSYENLVDNKSIERTSAEIRDEVKLPWLLKIISDSLDELLKSNKVKL